MMKNFNIRDGRCFAVALLGVFIASTAVAMPQVGMKKKFIGLCFDTLFNTPSNILDHAEELNKVPWLDGLAIGLKGVEVSTVEGKAVTSDTYRVVQQGHRWTRQSVAPQLKFCRELVKYPALKESFLLVWNTPVSLRDRLFWNDDKGWRLFAENLSTLAWFAKESGFKGLMIDSEEYANTRQFFYIRGDAASYEECAALARRRGQEVFSAVFKEYPDITLFFLWLFEDMVRHNSFLGELEPRQVAEDMGQLRHHFLNGMLDVMPPKVKIVDGAEHYLFSARRHEWWKGSVSQFIGATTFVDPKNLAKFRSQLSMSHGHYLDMYSIHSKPGGYYHWPVNGSRLEHLRINLVESLEAVDEYLWIYAEKGRLIDWKGGPSRHQSKKNDIWETQIPGMTKTLLYPNVPIKTKKKGE